MKKQSILTLCAILCAILFLSCQKVDELSNDAEIEKVTVSFNLPGTVILGTPVINERTIEIPLLYGKYNFPITVGLDFVTSPTCQQILNLDEDMTLKFDGINDKREIYTVSDSGATTRWSVVIKNMSNNDLAEIERFNIIRAISNGDIISGVSGMINGFDTTVVIPVVGVLAFPVIFDVNCMLSAGAKSNALKAKNEDATTEIRFNSARDVIKIDVESASGRKKVWSVSVNSISDSQTNDPSKLTDDQVERLTINDITISTPSTIILANTNSAFKTDSERGKIDLNIKNNGGGTITFPIDLTLDIGLDDNSVVLNAPVGNKYKFNGYGEFITIYVQDKLSGLIKPWDIVVQPEFNNSITNFGATFVSATIADINIDATGIIFDSATSSITIPVELTNGAAIPLTEIMELKVKCTYDITGGSANNEKELLFNDITSTATISTDDLTVQSWTVSLKDKNATPFDGKTTDIVSVNIQEMSGGSKFSDIVINTHTHTVYIYTTGMMPIYIKASFVTSDNATIEGIVNNLLIFSSYDDIKTVTVISADKSATQDWKIQIIEDTKIQIGNSDFELWGEFKDVNGDTFTIDPTPGVGYAWATANFKMATMGVQGTSPVDHNGGLAAQMKTQEQFTLIKGHVMAAGNIYTGVFAFNLSYITTPWRMTNLGVPFSGRPTSFNLDLKYTPGAQLRQATVKGEIYVIEDIEGIDKSYIWVELLRWDKSEPLIYNRFEKDENGNDIPIDGLTLIGEAELTIDGADNLHAEWSNVNIPMKYVEEHDNLTPTHIVVVMTSSKDGDKFIGATNSTLIVDNFVINY